MEGPIVNAYGPTENAVVSTVYCVSEYEQFGNGVPIGEPLTNPGAFIMGHHQRIAPKGVVGELVVTGDGLARGYLDPKLNNPFITVELHDQIVPAYPTGDLARVRPGDGELELLGRLDKPVKIRGNRGELQKSSTLHASKVLSLPRQ